jgi:PmbA protein
LIMTARSQAIDILEMAIGRSQAQQTEAVLIGKKLSLTRFAESVINQNISQEETRLVISCVTDKRVGIAASGDLTESGIKEAVEKAHQTSVVQQPDPRFISFPTPEQAPPLDQVVSVDPSLSYGPQEMAGVVAEATRAASEKNLSASGAFRHEINTVGVANSLGVRQFGRFGKSELSLTIVGEGEQSGYAITFSPDPARIDHHAAARTAIDKAVHNVDRQVLPDGQYTVILEPAAVGQLLLFLGFMGFGGRTMMQRRSFLAGKKGEVITGENITITDEPKNQAFGNLLFDYEGIGAKQITLIDRGRAGEAAFDSYYAGIMGVEPTGHALPPDNQYGPYPKSLAIATGDHSTEEMIASTGRGVLITHFWYLNFLNPMRTMITGTTFDGTFLVENGKMGPALKNMRTNQSILEAFANVEMISKNRIVYPQFNSLMLVPAMKINNFHLLQETKEEWEGEC